MFLLAFKAHHWDLTLFPFLNMKNSMCRLKLRLSSVLDVVSICPRIGAFLCHFLWLILILSSRPLSLSLHVSLHVRVAWTQQESDYVWCEWESERNKNMKKEENKEVISACQAEFKRTLKIKLFTLPHVHFHLFKCFALITEATHQNHACLTLA